MVKFRSAESVGWGVLRCSTEKQRIMRLRTLLLISIACSFLGACDQEDSSPGYLSESDRIHPMQGGWLGADGTVFHFRNDKTFHGYDFRHREFWGNWVVLSDERIGFQSLMHDAFYNPQYAIVDAENEQKMDYIVTGGEHFISAKRIPDNEAVAAINLVIEKSLHSPKD